MNLLRNMTMDEVYLPEGQCTEYNIGKQIYTGSATAFTKVTGSKAFNTFEKDMIECERHYYTVYITPPNARFHLNTYRLVPYGRRTQLMLEYQKVTRLNLATKPCSSLNAYNHCYDRCFHMVLSRVKIPCRLPFMTNMFNLSTCNSGHAAKRALQAYMDIAMTFDPLKYKECGCVQSCHETVVSCVDYTEPIDLMKMTVFLSLFLTNIQQHFVEVHADSLPSLICDIGGNLGSTLGFSLLSLFSMVESLVAGIYQKLKRNALKSHGKKCNIFSYVVRMFTKSQE